MKNFFLLHFLLVSTFLSFADVPAWVKNPDKAYPSSEYVKAVGEGNNLNQAQNSAVSGISLFFDTKTEIVATAIKQMSSIVEGDKRKFEANQYLSQAAQITSNAEFFCVKFTESYYDSKRDKFSVLAYINKKEAAQIYTSRINALTGSIGAYRDYAKSEKEPFLATMALHKAVILSEITKNYIHNENMLIPSDTGKFQPNLNTISLIPAEYDEAKKNVTFAISIVQKEKVFDPIFSTVASILERYGYAYSVKNPVYKIVVDISCIEESYNAGEFVRPSVDALVLNNAGEGMYTYSKAFPRIGGKTMEQAYTRSVTKIKQDLEENFLAE